ncbi:MAG: xanthine dehydrogenase accessory factor [Chthoniobacter sp.]|nr:xanthine dehydrogenase accessory factor [Chthoniobacter sp.]
MLLTAGGHSAGIINGGCLDSDLWLWALDIMVSGEAKLLCYDSTSPGDIVWGLGLGCRGVVKILIERADDLGWLCDGQTVATFFEGGRLGSVKIEAVAIEHPRIVEMEGGRALVETLQEPPPLWIFGAGADAVPLAALATASGWMVTVIDLRLQHPTRPGHLPARSVAPGALAELEVSPRAACVVMTHNFLHDLDVLRFLLPSPARYIGVLGPRSRADELMAELRKDGAQPCLVPSCEQLARLYAPVGLDIGAETPEEIALSILAEIRAATAGRSGGPLRERAGRIHKLERERTGIVILAAGKSARLGEPKQLLPFEGKSLLRRTAETALASRCVQVVVVIGSQEERMRAELAGLPLRIVQNDHWNLGLSTSVRAGLKALEDDVEAIVFVPCDQPALEAEILNRLVIAHEKSGTPIVVSEYGGVWGAPMLFARSVWGELKALQGDRGAQSVAHRHADEVECVPFPEGACDIDTREDYEALLEGNDAIISPTKTEIPLQKT